MKRLGLHGSHDSRPALSGHAPSVLLALSPGLLDGRLLPTRLGDGLGGASCWLLAGAAVLLLSLLLLCSRRRCLSFCSSLCRLRRCSRSSAACRRVSRSLLQSRQTHTKGSLIADLIAMAPLGLPPASPPDERGSLHLRVVALHAAPPPHTTTHPLSATPDTARAGQHWLRASRESSPAS